MSPALSQFSPTTQQWFATRFDAPTEPQARGWPAIASGDDTLIAAPTGSGKTLTAFLSSIDGLLTLAAQGELEDRLHVLYISPLRALSNDIRRNLEEPLEELVALAREAQLDLPEIRPNPIEIRAAVRTGDTPQSERQRMLRRPPHILVTTPESCYLLLTSARGREMLRTVETVIVDEIHALARDKRGSHLALSLERLAALCDAPPQRIGLSATQKPLSLISRYLTGDAPGREPARVIDAGHLRDIDLEVVAPELELGAICTHEHWAQIYEALVALTQAHRSTLIFVNTRRLSERITHQLTQRLGDDAVACHHGSLNHAMRQQTERRLKRGELRAVVATASLELGIDIGHVDLVCQIGTPRAIHTLLQRVGRAGHALRARPKGRLFALTRDDLIECLALARATLEGRLDPVEIPLGPLDVLAQQIVAEVSCESWDETALFDRLRRAMPYAGLDRAVYDQVVGMLAQGLGGRQRGAYLHRDQVGGQLRARRGANLTALTCGGAIPEITDFRVIIDADDTMVGTVDEDFAIESSAGDIFLLGNTSWQIHRVRSGEVRVRDAGGAPPTVPFWRGEAPGRTVELSEEVSRLRADVAELAETDTDAAAAWLGENAHVNQAGAEQAARYIAAQLAATGMVPTQDRILFERFFDEGGGMQLVVHAPFGTRINRAWGLCLRKRFCRSFNFELQASADDNGIVLSLGPQHSFPLEDMFSLVPARLVREILVQAMLAVPFFATRWRHNATRALAVRRWSGGSKVPPPLQRIRSDDLLSSVFPESTACLEHIHGDIELPDHPLVNQTLHDCLHEVCDLDRFSALLRRVEQRDIELVALDTREPSPFSHELLGANPYAFLDDAPLEERRARAVTLRRTISADAVRDLGALSPEAISQVCEEAWPLVRDPDELHDVLLWTGALAATDGAPWQDHFSALVAARRATLVTPPGGPQLWVAAERLGLASALWPDSPRRPDLSPPPGTEPAPEPEEAARVLVHGQLECRGPVTEPALSAWTGLTPAQVRQALLALEGKGVVLRGQFTTTDAGAPLEWCERRLLARIHRLTLQGLRARIAPVAPEQYVRFLAVHQHVAHDHRLVGQPGLSDLIAMLQGFEAPAGDWERSMLSRRLRSYDPAWLDLLSYTGRVAWGRLRSPARPRGNGRPMRSFTRVVPITLVQREDLGWLMSPPPAEDTGRPLGGTAQAVLELLAARGALFSEQLAAELTLLPGQLTDALGELAAAGRITSDGFGALRGLVASGRKLPTGGRWSALDPGPLSTDDERTEAWASQLLQRYGVMFSDLLAREHAAPRWGALVRVYRRLEARGVVRGGRFVTGVGGEQYALPDAVDKLRRVADDERPLVLPATDPLNLSGRITDGPLVPATRGNRIVLVQGRLVALRTKGEIRWADPPEDAARRASIEAELSRRPPQLARVRRR